MIALIQRVRHAQVDVGSETVGKIGSGLLVLLGVERHDTDGTAQALLDKVLAYRVFSDREGKMNLNVQQYSRQTAAFWWFRSSPWPPTPPKDCARAFPKAPRPTKPAGCTACSAHTLQSASLPLPAASVPRCRSACAMTGQLHSGCKSDRQAKGSLKTQ